MKSLLAIFPAGHFPFASPPDLRPIFFLALYPKDDHYGLWAAPRSPLSSGSYSVLPIESTSSQKMERETCCIFLSLLPPYFMTIAPARKLRSLALIGLCWHYFPAPHPFGPQGGKTLPLGTPLSFVCFLSHSHTNLSSLLIKPLQLTYLGGYCFKILNDTYAILLSLRVCFFITPG